MDDLQLLRDELTAWNDKNLDGWLGYYSDKSTFDVPGGVHLEGLDGARTFWAGYQDAFPDNRVVERRLFGEGGNVLFEGTFEGTHAGSLPTPDGQMIEPTGRPIRVPFCGLHRVANGVIGEYVLYFDQMELMIQLGLVDTAS